MHVCGLEDLNIVKMLVYKLICRFYTISIKIQIAFLKIEIVIFSRFYIKEKTKQF